MPTVTKEDGTKILDAPGNPSNVILKDPKSSEHRAVDPLLARLEGVASSPAADKKEGFLQDPSVIYLLLNVRV